MLNQYERVGGEEATEYGDTPMQEGEGKRHWYGASKRYDERALRPGTEGASMRVR